VGQFLEQLKDKRNGFKASSIRGGALGIFVSSLWYGRTEMLI